MVKIVVIFYRVGMANLIMTSSPSSNVNCSPSDNHSSYYSTIMFYFDILFEPYIFWFYNVYFLLLFDYCLFLPSLLETLTFNIVVLVLYHYPLDPFLLVIVSSSVLSLSKFSLFFGSTFPVFPSSMSFFCGMNKLFNFFKALFSTAGTVKLSILLFKSPAIRLTIYKIASATSPSVSSSVSTELTVSMRVWNINRNL